MTFPNYHFQQQIRQQAIVIIIKTQKAANSTKNTMSMIPMEKIEV